MRRFQICNRDNGLLSECAKKPQQDMMSQMSMMNPNMMQDMLKGNFSGMIAFALQFQWVNYFFSGFILGKVPLPLTQKFRMLLQKGLEIQNLDVRYVSSLSLYFLVMFGIGKFQQILMGGDEEDQFAVDDANNMKNMMGPMAMNPMMGMPGQSDPNKKFTIERDNLEQVKHQIPDYVKLAMDKLQNDE